ncbi:SDR family NAD(P)-dependent oxidoreductase [Burkholderia ubonensis]|uniref:SDR family NAD(P)-dependent oxidoreductase n=1 Tax=Burkholderia ubonensis TaxID=101571 RepID=UPI000BA74BCA|nr:SDR family NAD(P)-dependent oxidoreductase [Burkholderia ubonensis]PAJ85342.1 3-hydroxyacyl-CoA dehydrogenase [Burkholderia ubonensis]PAJ92288.1 3-hydroxyacyl-CoA dehydrogenase [Burkholderia ubonensis]PAK05644.1 3-hydroxyacyl-CoA dehydrogenase [Burkholderia ubonensis]PAK14474.1 3-hydroxyacyl-CoA dehydrogenase [Burkholderia ubonensis]RQP67674.1 SDR family NAD(P)-dependent oxidoreductase [Burkholderia ubonensis]
MRLEDTPVLVTGAASGLGAATARHLAGQGARVALLDINADGAKRIADDIGGLALECDVTDLASAESAVSAAREAHGHARILVNCAGGGHAKRVVGKAGPMQLDDFVKIVSLNLFGTFNMIRLAAADMAGLPDSGDGERGVIVSTASVAAYEGQIGQSAYAASKGGIVSLTIQLAREFAQFGIRVMSIAPGIFQTPLLQAASKEVQESLSAAIPFPRRTGDPSEFADLVRHIVVNRYLNGEVIRLDGAIRLAPR